MSYLLTVALAFFQAAPDDPPDPLGGGAKPAAAKPAGGSSVDDLLKEPGAKPAAPAGDAGTIGKPADFKPAGPAAAAPAEGTAAQPAPAAPPVAEAAATEASDSADSKGSFSKWWEGVKKSGALDLMIRGGVYMWPILILGILAAAVIIERYRSLKMLTTDSSALRSQVRELLQNDRIEEALALCEREQGPVAAILETGVRKLLVLRRLNYDAGRIEEQVVKSMDDYGVHIVAALERHLPILATVSSVAPMLGFLGTVSGMVNSFDEIKSRMGQENIVLLAAGGISEALITTMAGLVVGIPAFLAYNYYTSVINRFVLDVEESGSELIETVTLQMAIDEREKADAKEAVTT